MLKLQNEKLKAMFDWIKSQKNTKSLFFIYLIAFFLHVNNYNITVAGFVLFSFLLATLFFVLNLFYVQFAVLVSTFSVLSLLGMISECYSLFLIKIYVFGVWVPVTVSLLCKAFYTVTKGLTKQKSSILFVAFANFLSLIPAYAATQEISHGWAIRVIIYTLVSCSIIYALNKRKKLSFFSKIFSYPFWLLILEGKLLSFFKYGDESIYLILGYIGIVFFVLLSFFNIYTYYKAEDR